jgi:phenylpropionate dioxygenase-like ring-hydroxylating dioxygenase large terminal subunit
MRQYWVPAILSSELTADSDPVRVKLLGEELIAFRVTSGKVGLMKQACPHRCASLFYGRNEAEGIRCVYHGWKFAVDGTCLEQPNVDREGHAGSGVKAKAYPTIEKMGVVFAYLGPREMPPPFPAFPVFDLPEDEVAVWCAQRECNYLQAIEGEIDTTHAVFLHKGLLDVATVAAAGNSTSDLAHRAAKFKTEQTEFGILSGAYRPAPDDQTYWRFANFLFPFWTQIPPTPFGQTQYARAWVPMDDTHTMLFSITSDNYFGVGGRGRSENRTSPPPGITCDYEFLPNTSDWFGRWRLAANSRNDFLIDRDAQRRDSYTGITGLEVQDAAVCESMGEIVNHANEHLVPTDIAIVQMRRAMLKAATALEEENTVPPGVDDPAAFRQWSGFVTAPADQPWKSVYETNAAASEARLLIR